MTAVFGSFSSLKNSDLMIDIIEHKPSAPDDCFPVADGVFVEKT
jgi:hypothetical protein